MSNNYKELPAADKQLTFSIKAPETIKGNFVLGVRRGGGRGAAGKGGGWRKRERERRELRRSSD